MVEWLKRLAYAPSLRSKSRARPRAEDLVLRQQLNVLIPKLPKRLRLTNSDRALFGKAVPTLPSILSLIRIVRAPDRDPLAPSRLASLLVLEISPGRRPATDRR
jgi:hypothetical protein